MVGKLFHIQAPAKRADELLGQLSLTDAADRLVSEFSGGMKRRLDIAMSLVGNPQVIFLDEPTTGLDPQSRLELWGLIRDLKGKGVTIFLTTQYLDEAEQLADHIAVLNKGEIVADGTLEELKELLPHGRVKFGFLEKVALQNAHDILTHLDREMDWETLTLSVETGKDVAVLADILLTFKEKNIHITFLEQEEVSLEDVFLTLISNEKGRKQ